MKRLNNIGIIAVTVFFSTACTEKSSTAVEGRSVSQITATVADERTKTVLGENGTSVLWSPNDQISVFYNGDGLRFTSINTEPKATAMFVSEGTVVFGSAEGSGDTPYLYGIYPYSSTNIQKGESIALNVPATQTAAAGSFERGAYPSVGRSKDTDITFYNVCGGICFSVTNPDVCKVVFSGQNDEMLAGDVRVVFDQDGRPEVTEISSGQKELVLEAPEGSVLVPGKLYYISAIPTALSDGFRMVFYTASEHAVLSSSSAVEIKRSIFGLIDDADDGLTYEEGGAGDFDQTGITLSFGVISDVHINLSDGTTSQKFVSALNQLRDKAAENDSDGIDAILVDGDLIDSKNNAGQMAEFKSRYESVFDPKEVPMVYTPGNHEVSWNSGAASNVAFMRNGLGADYFLADRDSVAGVTMECRHCEVGGCDILTILPAGNSPVTYSDAARNWLDTTLHTITRQKPDRYVIVLTHPMIYNTVYGSLLGWEGGEWSSSNTWATKDLTSILEKYPQVIVFGGHLHFPLNDPRSIWQGEFTAFGCSSVRYMAIENGYYDTMTAPGATTLTDAHSVSQGHLLQMDKNGNVRVTRMDFSKQAVIGEPYNLSFPVPTKEHLAAYSSTARSLANEAPAPPEAVIKTESGVTSVTFGATDDEFVHDYTLTLTRDNKTCSSFKVISDFYLNPQTSTMSGYITRSLGYIEDGSYTLTIVARDSWGRTSTLEKTFTVEGFKTIWVNDDADTESVEGGRGSVAADWLSYSDGTLSWTENTTGKPRTGTITLPSGMVYKVSQLDPKDFKGSWSVISKYFGQNNPSLKGGNANNKTVLLTAGEPTLTSPITDCNGLTRTACIGFRGFYDSAAVMNAAVDIQYGTKTITVSLLLDAGTAQETAVSNVAGYDYVCFLPEMATTGQTGTSWNEPWNFVQADLDATNDYMWLEFTGDEGVTDEFNWNSFTQARYMNGSLKTSANRVIGITCAVSKSSEATSSNVYQTYNIIYQANTSSKVMTIKRN